MLIRDDLKEQYNLMHKENKFTGKSLKPHIDDITKLIKDLNIKSVLDYGCGGASHYQGDELSKLWGDVEITLYDPYNDKYKTKPNKFVDLVICTDVMEHIPEEDVRDVLIDIINYADRAIYFCICTKEAKKNLPDGRNAHLTVRDEEWWDNIIGECKLNRHIEIIKVYT